MVTSRFRYATASAISRVCRSLERSNGESGMPSIFRCMPQYLMAMYPLNGSID